MAQIGEPVHIGEPLKTIVVEPLEVPVGEPGSQPEPLAEPEPAPEPQPATPKMTHQTTHCVAFLELAVTQINELATSPELSV